MTLPIPLIPDKNERMSARPESFRHDSKIDSLRVPPQSVEA